MRNFYLEYRHDHPGVVERPAQGTEPVGPLAFLVRRELVGVGQHVLRTVVQRAGAHYHRVLQCDVHGLVQLVSVGAGADRVGHQANTVVNHHHVLHFQAVCDERHDPVVEISPSVEVPNVDAALAEPVPVADVDAVLAGVRLVVAPGVTLVARTAAGDKACLGPARHYVVLHDGLLRPLDVDAAVELHAEQQHLDVGDALPVRDQVAHNVGAAALAKLDPRDALLKWDSKADEAKGYTLVYNHTQPKAKQLPPEEPALKKQKTRPHTL